MTNTLSCKSTVVITVNRVQDVCANAIFSTPDAETDTHAVERRFNDGRHELDEARYLAAAHRTVHVGDWFVTSAD